MNVAKAFTFFLEDERVVNKLGIGVAVILISLMLSPILIGIAGFLVLVGYSVRLLQNVRDGLDRPLPEWDRWGEDMVDGLKLTVAGLVYAIPVFILMIPTIIGAALTDSSASADFVGIPLIICGACLMVIYGLFLTLAQPGIMVAFAREKTIGSALRFSGIWEWTRRNIGPVIIVSLIYIGASALIPFVAVVAGTLLLVIGLLVTIPLGTLLLSLVQAHLYGQLAAADPMDGVLRTPGYAPMMPPSAPAGPMVPVAPMPPVTPVDPFAAAPADVAAPAPDSAPDSVAFDTPKSGTSETPDENAPIGGLDI